MVIVVKMGARIGRGARLDVRAPLRERMHHVVELRSPRAQAGELGLPLVQRCLAGFLGLLERAVNRKRDDFLLLTGEPIGRGGDVFIELGAFRCELHESGVDRLDLPMWRRDLVESEEPNRVVP